MKVLMLTPGVDPEHDIFGFIYGWVWEISRRVDRLVVITPRIGTAKMPENVEVIGVEGNIFSKLLQICMHLWRVLRKGEVDIIFTHMYDHFSIIAAPYKLIFGKPIVVFHAHGTVTWTLKLEHFFANRIATSSKKGYRIISDKVVVIGQGIDTEKFKPTDGSGGSDSTIVSVGRIGRVKDYGVLLKAINILVNEKGRKLNLIIVGPVYNRTYHKELEHLIEEYSLAGSVAFSGPTPFSEIAPLYQKADLYTSASSTGSLDKTTLEAMACSLPVVVCNEAFLDIFEEEMKEKCYFEKGNYRELAEKIEHFMDNKEQGLRDRLRKEVMENHDMKGLAEKLVKVFYEVIK